MFATSLSNNSLTFDLWTGVYSIVTKLPDSICVASKANHEYEFKGSALVRDIVDVNQEKIDPKMEPSGTPAVRVHIDYFIYDQFQHTIQGSALNSIVWQFVKQNIEVKGVKCLWKIYIHWRK